MGWLGYLWHRRRGYGVGPLPEAIRLLRATLHRSETPGADESLAGDITAVCKRLVELRALDEMRAERAAQFLPAPLPERDQPRVWVPGMCPSLERCLSTTHQLDQAVARSKERRA